MIDYCTMVVCEAERDFLARHVIAARAFIKNIDIKISIIPGDMETIKLCEKLGLEFLEHEIFTQHELSGGLRQAGFDCANRMDKLVRSCRNEWVIISHMDIIWKSSFEDLISRYCIPGYGMIGKWPHGCTIVNRELYEKCHHGFWPNGGWLGQVCYDGEYVAIQIIGSDERKNKVWWDKEEGKIGDLINIDGVDVASLLRIEIQTYGYKFHHGDLHEHYLHIGGLSFK